MLRISKTIKKIALSLLVIGLAIGFQSYKNAEKKLVVTRYIISYDAVNEEYEFQTGSPLNCNKTETDNPCEITTVAGTPDLPASGTISKDDVENQNLISIETWRANY